MTWTTELSIDMYIYNVRMYGLLLLLNSPDVFKFLVYVRMSSHDISSKTFSMPDSLSSHVEQKKT